MNRRGFLGSLVAGVLGLLGVRTVTAAPVLSRVQVLRVVSRTPLFRGWLVGGNWYSAIVQEVDCSVAIPRFHDTGIEVWLTVLKTPERMPQEGDLVMAFRYGPDTGLRIGDSIIVRPRFVCV